MPYKIEKLRGKQSKRKQQAPAFLLLSGYVKIFARSTKFRTLAHRETEQKNQSVLVKMKSEAENNQSGNLLVLDCCVDVGELTPTYQERATKIQVRRAQGLLASPFANAPR